MYWIVIHDLNKMRWAWPNTIFLTNVIPAECNERLLLALTARPDIRHDIVVGANPLYRR